MHKAFVEIAPSREREKREVVNRKLIRASLSDLRIPANGHREAREKQSSVENTTAESNYYLKQMLARTPMAVVLDSGDVLHGVIEWYDKQCIKISRMGEPNILVMKSAIRYVYKQPADTPGKAVPVSNQEPPLCSSNHKL